MPELLPDSKQPFLDHEKMIQCLKLSWIQDDLAEKWHILSFL